MSDIFLSYSRQDADIMRRVRTDLRSAGFTVWTDETGLIPGTSNWQRAIHTAIDHARCMVVILPPDAEQLEWVEPEISYAELLGLRIFPVLVRGTERNAIPCVGPNGTVIEYSNWPPGAGQVKQMTWGDDDG